MITLTHDFGQSFNQRLLSKPLMDQIIAPTFVINQSPTFGTPCSTPNMNNCYITMEYISLTIVRQMSPLLLKYPSQHKLPPKNSLLTGWPSNWLNKLFLPQLTPITHSRYAITYQKEWEEILHTEGQGYYWLLNEQIVMLGNLLVNIMMIEFIKHLFLGVPFSFQNKMFLDVVHLVQNQLIPT